MTVGYGTSLAQTTAYAYDTQGRVKDVTRAYGTSLATTFRTYYNNDNTVQQTIANYKNGVFDPTKPAEDIITNYGYDGLGRQIWVQNVLGEYISFTHYNSKGQVDWTVRNPRDGSGLPVVPTSLPTYSPTRPDATVVTRYGYDGLGRTAVVTETGILTGSFTLATRTFSQAAERVTRTEYDTLSRPVTVTLNYQPGQPVDSQAAVNVRTLTYYDGASN